MKQITKETLKTAANKLMFDMSEEEYDILLSEFEVLKEQMALISSIEGIDEATPMTFPFDASTSFLREDEPTTPLEVETALKNAKDVVEGQIRLPKVVG